MFIIGISYPSAFFASINFSDESKWLALDIFCKNIKNGNYLVLPLSETSKSLRRSIANSCGYLLTKKAVKSWGFDIVGKEINRTRNDNLIDFKIAIKHNYRNYFIDNIFSNILTKEDVLSKIRRYRNICEIDMPYSILEKDFLYTIYNSVNCTDFLYTKYYSVNSTKEMKYITTLRGRYFIDFTEIFKKKLEFNYMDKIPHGVIYYDNGRKIDPNNIKPLFQNNLNSHYHFASEENTNYTINFHNMFFFHYISLFSSMFINGNYQTNIPEEIIFPENYTLKKLSLHHLQKVSKLDLSYLKNLKTLKISDATALKELILPSGITYLEITYCDNLSTLNLSQSIKLKELILCQTKNLKKCIVTHAYPSLKKLKIGSFLSHRGCNLVRDCDPVSIIIDAFQKKIPNLKQLKVDDCGKRQTLSRHAHYPREIINVANLEHLEFIDISRTKRNLAIYNCKSLKAIRLIFDSWDAYNTSLCSIENSGTTNFIIDSFSIRKGQVIVKNCSQINALILTAGLCRGDLGRFIHKEYLKEFIKNTMITDCPNLKIMSYKEFTTKKTGDNLLELVTKKFSHCHKFQDDSDEIIKEEETNAGLKNTVVFENFHDEKEHNDYPINEGNDEHINHQLFKKYALPLLGLAGISFATFLLIKYYKPLKNVIKFN